MKCGNWCNCRNKENPEKDSKYLMLKMVDNICEKFKDDHGYRPAVIVLGDKPFLALSLLVRVQKEIIDHNNYLQFDFKNSESVRFYRKSRVLNMNLPSIENDTEGFTDKLVSDLLNPTADKLEVILKGLGIFGA